MSRNENVQKWKFGVKEEKGEEVRARPVGQKAPLVRLAPHRFSILLTSPQAHTDLQVGPLPSGTLSQPGGATCDWLSQGQSALPLRFWQNILPQLRDRFLSAGCVEIIPLLLPNIIYSCLIFSLHLKAAKLK